MRRCPRHLIGRNNDGHGDGDRDAILCVVGDWFAYARDRRYPLPDFPDAAGGGCANLADAAWAKGDIACLRELVDLEGSVGRVRYDCSSSSSGGGGDGGGQPQAPWTIEMSTLPWREGVPLLRAGECELQFENSGERDQGSGGGKENIRLASMRWGEDVWEVLECSMDSSSLRSLFGTTGPWARL